MDAEGDCDNHRSARRSRTADDDPRRLHRRRRVSTVVAQLRLFKATEGDSDATGGILMVPGVGAWAVSCSRAVIRLTVRVDLFDFDLPDERIALRPAEPRDAARLLVVRPGGGVRATAIVRDLPSLLEPGDVLVFNDTKVIPAQLERHPPARRSVGAGRRDAAHARRRRPLEGLRAAGQAHRGRRPHPLRP